MLTRWEDGNMITSTSPSLAINSLNDGDMGRWHVHGQGTIDAVLQTWIVLQVHHSFPLLNLFEPDVHLKQEPSTI